MKQIKRQIPASTEESIAVVGRYVYLKAATGGIRVRARGSDEYAEMTAGEFVRFDDEFSEISIEDTSGAQNSITLIIAKEGDAGKFSNVTLAVPGTLGVTNDVNCVTGATTLIMAANGNRHRAIIEVDGACRIGGATVNANGGVKLAAGASIPVETTAAIYLRNDSGASVVATMTYTEF